MSNLTSIRFRHQTILAFEHEGKPYVAMRPIVENLGLDWKSQYQKINAKFGRCVVILTTHDSSGRQQEMLCLPASKIAGFLYTISPSKVKPELRELVTAYQDECTEVLYQHFFGKVQGEHNALITALFAKHPLWQQTLELAQLGLSQREIGQRQGRCRSSVGGMLKRMGNAGLQVLH